jgi:hypothetical protein
MGDDGAVPLTVVDATIVPLDFHASVPYTTAVRSSGPTVLVAPLLTFRSTPYLLDGEVAEWPKATVC